MDIKRDHNRPIKLPKRLITGKNFSSYTMPPRNIWELIGEPNDSAIPYQYTDPPEPGLLARVKEEIRRLPFDYEMEE